MSDGVSRSHHRAPRLFVDSRLTAGSALPLAREQAHYLRNVMRRDLGAPAICFNGQDGEWLAEVEFIGKRDAALTPTTLLRPQPDVSTAPTLLFAAVKRGPVELIIEKGVELGVGRFQLVATERANRDKLNPERLQRIAVEAAEQCERMDVPPIAPIAPLNQVLAEWPPGAPLIVGDETGKAPAALDALADIRADIRQDASATFGLLIGPEGGFASGELDAFDQFAFVRRVGFGPRVLRAETAVIVGLTLTQAVLGDLTGARETRRT